MFFFQKYSFQHWTVFYINFRKNLSKLFFQKFTTVSAIRYSSFKQRSGVERTASAISKYRVSNNFNTAKRKNATSIIHDFSSIHSNIHVHFFFFFPFSLFLYCFPQSHFPRGIYFSNRDKFSIFTEYTSQAVISKHYVLFSSLLYSLVLCIFLFIINDDAVNKLYTHCFGSNHFDENFGILSLPGYSSNYFNFFRQSLLWNRTFKG